MYRKLEFVSYITPSFCSSTATSIGMVKIRLTSVPRQSGAATAASFRARTSYSSRLRSTFAFAAVNLAFSSAGESFSVVASATAAMMHNDEGESRQVPVRKQRPGPLEHAGKRSCRTCHVTLFVLVAPTQNANPRGNTFLSELALSIPANVMPLSARCAPQSWSSLLAGSADTLKFTLIARSETFV